MSDLDNIFEKIEKSIEAESEKYDTTHTDSPATPVLELGRVNIPIIGQTTRHSDCVTIHGEHWQAAYERAKVCAESGGLIVAYGGRGTGKTQMAFHLARQAKFPNAEFAPIYKNGFTPEVKPRHAIYTKAMEIFLDCKHSFNRKDSPTLKRYCRN